MIRSASSHRKFQLILFLVVLFVGVRLHAEKSLNAPDSIRLWTYEYLRRVGSFGNAGQLIIADTNGIILQAHYGYANRYGKIPTTDETVFEIASASKMFTAAAVLRLESEKRLSLDDTLATFFDEVPSDKRDISLLQLLTHTSGLRGGDLVDDFDSVSKLELIRAIFESKLVATSGTKWVYSNAGYNLLAAVIEKVSGKPYETFLKEAFFIPLGMHHTFVSGTSDLIGLPTAHAYRGHQDNGGPERQTFNPRTWGGGSVSSTASDLYLWIRALKGLTVLKETAWRKMTSQLVKISSENNYGLGCFSYESEGRAIVDAIGSTERGFNCTMRMYLNDGSFFIFLSNGSQPTGEFDREFIDPRIRHFMYEKGRISMPPEVKASGAELDDMTGLYVLDSNSIQVDRQGDVLVMRPQGQDAVDFVLGHDDKACKKLQIVRRRAESFADAFLDGRADELGKILTENQLPSYLDERSQILRAYGALRAFSVEGAHFVSDTNFIVCWIKMEFERQTSCFFTMWNCIDQPPKVDYTEMVACGSPYGRTFVPVEDGTLVSYNFKSARAEVELSVRKTAGRIVLSNNKNNRHFTRK